MVYCAGKLIENFKLFECSPNFHLGYHAGKPIETVIYCLNVSSFVEYRCVAAFVINMYR